LVALDGAKALRRAVTHVFHQLCSVVDRLPVAVSSLTVAKRIRAAYRNPDALLGEVDLQVPY
jgi:hypothetical protein